MEENAQKLTIVRNFSAPIEGVWDAWTKPEIWSKWYGKPGEVPMDGLELDVRVGGKWKSTTLIGGNKVDFSGNYKEVDAPEKLVMVFENPDDPQDRDVETVTVKLREAGDGKTEMTFTQEGNLPPEEYQKGLKEGWMGFFDALDIYLNKNHS